MLESFRDYLRYIAVLLGGIIVVGLGHTSREQFRHCAQHDFDPNARRNVGPFKNGVNTNSYFPRGGVLVGFISREALE